MELNEAQSVLVMAPVKVLDQIEEVETCKVFIFSEVGLEVFGSQIAFVVRIDFLEELHAVEGAVERQNLLLIVDAAEYL